MNPGDIFNPFKMFVGVFIPNALAKYKGLSPSAKIVWGRLAQYAGNRGRCFPSQETLAEEVGLTRRQVRRLISELEEQKFIVCSRPESIDRLSHKGNEYAFLWHEIFCEKDQKRTSGEDIHVPWEEDQKRTSGGDMDVPSGEDIHVPCNIGVRESGLKESSLSPASAGNRLSVREREKVTENLKRLFPGMTGLPEAVPSARAFLFLHKVRSGEIRKEQIYSPVAYMVKMADEDITELLRKYRAAWARESGAQPVSPQGGG